MCLSLSLSLYIHMLSCTFVIFYRIYCNEYLLWFLQLWSIYQLPLPLLDVFLWLASSLLFLSTLLNSTLLLSGLCVRVWVRACEWVHWCMHVRVCVHACVRTHVRVCVCVCVCVRVCVCVCKHACTPLHIRDQYSSSYDAVLSSAADTLSFFLETLLTRSFKLCIIMTSIEHYSFIPVFVTLT